MIEGKRIILTRAADKNEPLATRIAEASGTPVVFPTIATTPVSDDHVIRAALTHLERFAFIVFTSAEAVAYLGRLLPTLPCGEGQPQYAAVGSVTAEALRAHGVSEVLVPDDFRAEGLIEIFAQIAQETAPGAAVLIPRALVAREVLPQALEQLGFNVTVAPLYETVMPEVDARELGRIVNTDKEPQLLADAVVFASSSAVRNFVTIMGRASLDGAALLARVDCYSIGAPTTAALRRIGVPEERVHQAAEATTDGLFTALIS
ncbi:MAG: uroporphyrinogen-III synthase [Actinomycetia bacterium]|nr:uroporphyrinogen-III synthase [Actinomycetes bacterium]